MKKFFSFTLVILLLSSCQKDKEINPPDPVVDPVMQYQDLQNAFVKFGQFKKIDINTDGTADFAFATLLVGDPILERDRMQYYAFSTIGTNLLNDMDDQSPMLNKGDQISIQHTGYQWFEISAILLTEKIIPMTGLPFWEGLWKQASHKYLPVQITKTGQVYHGWIELSFDTTAEQIILHKAAICTEPGKAIKAGF